jgi:glycosyltransferase involved in cell wall biosynthesis
LSPAAIRLAFPLIGRGIWTGGLVYLKNTLRLIGSRLSREIQASVFLSPAENERFGPELSPLVDGRLIVDSAIGDSGRGRSLVRALATGHDMALERLLRAARIDAVLEVGQYYGARFKPPVIAWLPDLQHRYMPEMFSRLNWWRRDLAFRMQIRSGRTLMVSSETVRDDMERFYPRARGRGHIVRFAIELDIGAHLRQGADMRAQYDLPDRFFFLPNQFWRHKNHAVVVEALGLLKGQGALEATLPVILSGSNKDVRNPGHFAGLFSAARAAGVEGHFRYLGLIPYDHVLNLSACCAALINPSQFEGWSTPIEEAKALGAALILADIPIHREQAPDANFFDPTSPAAAAAVLLDISRRPDFVHAPAEDLITQQSRRLDQHAASLLETVTAAVGPCSRSRSHTATSSTS